MEQKSGSLLEVVEKYAASETLNLPIFPGVARELYGKIADENCSIGDIATIIGKDQAMAGQMLKLANSAFFAGLNKVRTIRESIMRLGVRQVYNCLVATSQKDFYVSRDPAISKHLAMLWQHALATAKGTQWLLRKTGYSEAADEGFLAGLFHDIGKLLLLKVFETIKAERKDVALSESFVLEILDFMHVEQGYRLMMGWSIPEIYCEVAKRHHEEDIDNSDPLLLAVRIVDRVCAKIGISLKPDPTISPATLPEVMALSVKEIVLAELEVLIEDTLGQQL
ncbi:MAG: HDOD domain-containing protein [Syntrophobacteraceae bacterium]|nr:HDOD domain-containing protein [Syntrophobacteraceae bacterium]